MTREQQRFVTHSSNVRAWKCGELPVPDWVPKHIVGGIEANGTFSLATDRGNVRVHPGNVVIEQCGTVWVRPGEEVSDFMKRLEFAADPTITNIGPGKRRQFGIGGGSRTKGEGRSANLRERPVYLPPVGSQPSIEWVHLNRLSIDSTYQRSTDNEASRRLIAGIAAKFDWRLCAPLVVSRRADDTLTIIDGQHRWMAACRRDDIPQLPCCVFRYESIKEEARMFIVANRARRPINRLDDYYAALAAADEDALEIRQLVSSAGLNIARTTSAAAWRPGEVAFTSSIANAIRRFGAADTLAALTNMAVAFPGQKLMHGGAIFGGLVRIISQRAPDFDPDRLISALQTRTADEWGVYAAGLTSGDRRVVALRDAIMDTYDKLSSAAEP
jgi:ParB-like nuclease domain